MSSTSSSRTSSSVRLLAAAFLLSGAAALMYQVLWTRMLGHVFGVTIQAASTVFACFMAGLAIGSYLAGRFSDRLGRPLVAFALVETGIAVTAVLTPAALAIAQSAYIAVYPSLGESEVIHTLARVAFSSLVLIAPASLMGATFPLVVTHVTRAGETIASRTSFLYGVNTAGAILGTLLGGLWLLPTLGMRGTFAVAAALNLAAAAGAWVASRVATTTPAIAASPETFVEPADSTSFHLAPRTRYLVLGVMAVSGFVSLALEIAWFRVLVFFLRPTTYGFASMLATVLFGLALGSLVIAPRLRRSRDWLLVLGLLEIGIGVSAILAFSAIAKSFDVMTWAFGLTWTWLPAPFDFVAPLMITAAVAILPPAVLLGAAFPIGVLLWSDPRHARPVGRRVGLVYSLNVAGGILGSLVAGFVLVPLVGTQRTLVLAADLALAGGLVLLTATRRQTAIAIGLIAVAGIAVVTSMLPDLFRAVIERRYRGQAVIWHDESAQSTVTVTQRGSERTLLIDGMHHASGGANVGGFHRLLGMLGVAVHPDPREVLVIGLGGGITASSASILPTSTVDVVELSPGVISAVRWFRSPTNDVERRPNVRIRRDDGRNHLLVSGRKYDVMTADLLLPEMAGAASLNSVEYYRLGREALKPGGLAVQWIPADSDRRYKLMLRTFLAAYPHVTTWAGGSIAIGSNEPLVLSRSAFEAKLRDPAVAESLTSAGLGSFEALLDQFNGGPLEARTYVGDGPILEDNWPVIEYFLSLPRNDAAADAAQFRSSPQPYVAE